MFDFDRFTKLLRHLWEHSPKWYLVLPSIAFIGLLTFGMLVDGDDGLPRYAGTDASFLTPVMVGRVMLFANAIALLIISVHFVSRHFRDLKAKTDTISLPSSLIEKYAALVLVVLVVIPLLGLLSSVLTFGLLKLIGLPGYYPRWSWMDGRFVFSLLIYYLLVLPYFALSFIRSRQTILWGLGIGLAFALVCGLIVQTDPEFLSNSSFAVNDLYNGADTEDLYGPTTDTEIVLYISPLGSLSDRTEFLAIYGIGFALLLLSSGWIALKNRQI